MPRGFLKSLYFLTTLLLLNGGFLWSQAINVFPYLEDFDAFPVSSTISPVVEPNPDAFPANWTNDTINDGDQDWYALSSPTLTTNTGPNRDHTSGNGVFLYVEDSGSGANNDEVSILSPLFDISNLNHPRLSYWIHSRANVSSASYGADSSLNEINVDILYAGSWITIDSIDTAGIEWTERILALDSFAGLVQFRFTVNNNNFGDFVHDIAIDDFMIFGQQAIDGAILSASYHLVSPPSYVMAPYSQNPSYQLECRIQNRGILPISGGLITVDFDEFQDSAYVDTLLSLEDTLMRFSTKMDPHLETNGVFELFVIENDTYQVNNFQSTTLKDTVFARDHGRSDGGLGFSAPNSLLGTMFELNQPDECTSASFFLNSSTIGDSLRILLFRFDHTMPGQPEPIPIDSTNYWQIDGLGWHSLSFDCPVQLIPGKYLLAVEQANANNLGFGYCFDGFTPATTYFNTSSGSMWDTLEAVIPGLQVAMMLRLNFGPTFKTEIQTVENEICIGDSISLIATGTGSFSWTGNSLHSIVGQQVTAQPDSTYPNAEYTVVVTDLRGCKSTDTFYIRVNPLPLNTLLVIDEMNNNKDGFASIHTIGGHPPYQYFWNDSSGQTGSQATGLSAGTYIVTTSDSNGCRRSDTVNIGSISSIEEVINPNRVHIYPNPSRGDFFVDMSFNAERESVVIEMISLAGKTMQLFVSSSNKTESFQGNESLAAGSYVMIFHTKQAIYKDQLVIID